MSFLRKQEKEKAASHRKRKNALIIESSESESDTCADDTPDAFTNSREDGRIQVMFYTVFPRNSDPPPRNTAPYLGIKGKTPSRSNFPVEIEYSSRTVFRINSPPPTKADF